MGDLTVRLRIQCGYYDGILTGLGEVEGEPVWFVCNNVHEDDRTYDVYPLTADEAEWEWERHRRFEQVVGRHTCSVATCGTPQASFKQPPGWLSFYDDKTVRDYTDREPLGVIGWSDIKRGEVTGTRATGEGEAQG